MAENRNPHFTESQFKMDREKIIKEFEALSVYAHDTHNSIEKTIKTKTPFKDLNEYKNLLQKYHLALITKPLLHLRDNLCKLDICPRYKNSASQSCDFFIHYDTEHLHEEKQNNKKRKSASEAKDEKGASPPKRKKLKIEIPASTAEPNQEEENRTAIHLSTEIIIDDSIAEYSQKLSSNVTQNPSETALLSSLCFFNIPLDSPRSAPAYPVKEHSDSIPLYTELNLFFPVKNP